MLSKRAVQSNTKNLILSSSKLLSPPSFFTRHPALLPFYPLFPLPPLSSAVTAQLSSGRCSAAGSCLQGRLGDLSEHLSPSPLPGAPTGCSLRQAPASHILPTPPHTRGACRIPSGWFSHTATFSGTHSAHRKFLEVEMSLPRQGPSLCSGFRGQPLSQNLSKNSEIQPTMDIYTRE